MFYFKKAQPVQKKTYPVVNIHTHAKPVESGAHGSAVFNTPVCPPIDVWNSLKSSIVSFLVLMTLSLPKKSSPSTRKVILI